MATNAPTIKVLQLFAEQACSESKACATDGCSEMASGGKSYCTTHVENESYIKALLSKIEVRETEDQQVLIQGSDIANLTSITARDIIAFLKMRGTATEEAISRELLVDRSIIHAYALKLHKEGLLHFGVNDRNSMLVIWNDFCPDLAINDDED